MTAGDWEEFVECCERLLARIEDLPERAYDFAEGVHEKISEMCEWAEENQHVTDKMITAYANIEHGVSKWER